MDTGRRANIALLSTGGTIEKTYDPTSGVLSNDVSVLDVMLDLLELEGVDLHRQAVMNKDSLDMTAEDHQVIADTAAALAHSHDGVLIVHGTDTLEYTGERLAAMPAWSVPVVLTGAMRPWILRTTDALQNLTEALLAVQVLEPGVWVCMHNRVLRFPGVVKDRVALRFVRRGESDG